MKKGLASKDQTALVIVMAHSVRPCQEIDGPVVLLDLELRGPGENH